MNCAANLSEGEKAECILVYLNCAQAEREFYKFSCSKSKETLETLGPEALINLQIRDASTLAATMHYSFDSAQQVHIPSDPMQPGPIYFDLFIGLIKKAYKVTFISSLYEFAQLVETSSSAGVNESTNCGNT